MNEMLNESMNVPIKEENKLSRRFCEEGSP